MQTDQQANQHMEQQGNRPLRSLANYAPYCSLGLIWAWVYCSWKTELLFPEMERTNILSDPSWLGNIALVIALSFATPAIVRRLDARGRKALVAVATACMAIGVVLSAVFAGSAGLASIASLAAGALTGAGSGVLLSVCGAQLTRLTSAQLTLAVPLNVLFVPLCSAFVPMLEGTAGGVVFVAALPLCAGGLLLTLPDISPGMRRVDAREAEPKHGPHAKLRLARMLVVLTLANIAESCVLLTRSADTMPSRFDSLASFFQANMVMSTVLGVIVFLAAVSQARNISFQKGCQCSISLTIAGLACSIMGNTAIASAIGTLLANIGTLCFDLLFYIAFVQFAKREKLSPYAAFGLIMGVKEIGVLLGSLAGVGILALNAESSAYTTQVALSILVLAIAAPLTPSLRSNMLALDEETHMPADDNATANGWAEQAADEQPAGPDAPEGAAAKVGRDELIAHRLQDLAIECKLTARETEVCLLVANGRSRPFICDKLCLSKNTVDSHIRHAYAKLGVHSSQELIDLLESDE